MAKKSKRSRVKFRATQQSTGNQQIQATEPVRVETISKVKGSAVSSATTQIDRYQYVVSELLRIGVIAGALFIVLIVLSFVIQ
jgi:hypothetical protein